jgi:histidinol phosphatase-like PHP family hydrolase
MNDNHSLHSSDFHRVNVHVHSAFSDGLFTPSALVLQAIERNVSVLGISDHYFTSKTPSIRPERLEPYIDELDRIADQFESEIRVLKGIEIDTVDMFIQGKELPPLRLLERLDFVLLEYVTNIPRAGIPIMHAALIARDIPVPTGLAHTDLAMAFPGIRPEELVDKLVSAEIFVELNETYCRPGERKPFYTHYIPYLEVARPTSLAFSAGTDAHGPIVGPARNAIEFLEIHGMADRLFFNRSD